ncbi:MAG: DNA polymerase III subunit delta [Alphaproteobacteria bacterium]|nr:DNA polymerase III subunit delta [Alphaproteobacteria bacterium]
MTIIKPYDANRFIKKLPPDTGAILFYGPNLGLSHERARQVISVFLDEKVDDPFALVRLSADDLATNEARLRDELYARPLSGGRNCVWIHPGSPQITKLLSTFSKEEVPDTLLIVETGNLTPGAALRTLFERHQKWAAIACYADNKRDLEQMLDKTIMKANLKIQSEARLFLLSHLGADRMVSRMEIEKICLYAEGQLSPISLEDIIAITSDVSARDVDPFLDGLGLGDFPGTDARLHSLLESGTPHTHLITRAISHFQLLHELRCEVEKGKSATSVVENRKPAVFFKRKEALIRQCARWKQKELEIIQNQLHEGMKMSRRSDGLSRIGIVRILLDVAARTPSAQSSAL